MVRAWFQRLGESNPSFWDTFVDRLRKDSVDFDEPNSDASLPGIVFLDGPGEENDDELADRCRCTSGPVIAVASSRSDLREGRLWRLLRLGVNDVLVLDECAKPATAIVARLRHIQEIEQVLESDLIKTNLVGESPAWRSAIRQVVRLAQFSGGSILITGESGTGKELVAQLVHTLDSRADKGKLVIMDCTTVSPELSGSEFFGHERGAFTNAVAARDGVFALADKGTLFLDEVGELPLALQAELLRAVQERTYKRVGSNTWRQTEFRLVCATNRNLAAEEAKGNFRLDFYHRIACSQCHLPPLRERREDILPLARHFLEKSGNDSRPLDFDPAVQDFLQSRHYPGNVRELRHLVARIAQRHVGPGPITPGAIPEADRNQICQQMELDWRDGEFEGAIRRALSRGSGLHEIREQTVEAVIRIALKDAHGNVQRAALKLGVTDRALQLRRAAQKGTARESESHHSVAPDIRRGGVNLPTGTTAESARNQPRV